MLKQLKALFKEGSESPIPNLSEHDKQLACAALMIEIATIDQDFDSTELATLTYLLQHRFGVSSADVQTLIDEAESQHQETASLYPYTRLVNDELDIAAKYDLVVSMWRIAFADGELDKYEEHMIRKVADLIHLPHSEFIRAKHQAKSNDPNWTPLQDKT